MEVDTLFYVALCDDIAKGNKQSIILHDDGVRGRNFSREHFDGFLWLEKYGPKIVWQLPLKLFGEFFPANIMFQHITKRGEY